MVTFQATLVPKSSDEGPSAVTLSGSITSLTQITLQSHARELRHLDCGCYLFPIQVTSVPFLPFLSSL